MSIEAENTAQVTGGRDEVRSPDIARALFRSVEVYAPNKEPTEIDLSDNTNLWGTPPHALQALQDVAASTVSRYPPLGVPELTRAIADSMDVAPEMVVTGCGSDNVLDCALRAFGNPGDTVAHPAPSFGMIPIFARLNGLQPLATPLTETFDADAEQMLSTRAKITYLCSPNNPTGNALRRETIERICDDAEGLVIVDEAYVEFARNDRRADALALLRRSPRVLVTRTLSKAFGLAGARIGYGVGAPVLIAEIMKARGPYTVSAVAARAGAAALRKDRRWVDEHVREAVRNRERLAEALRAMGLSPVPSDANFLLVPVADSESVDRALRKRGVAVRAFRALPNVGDALRIAVGPWPMLDACVRALREVLSREALA